MIFRFFKGAAVLAMALMAGCGSSPKVNYYSLQGPAQPPRQGQSPQTPSLSVQVGLVSVPELVDRLQLVARLSDNRLEISDSNRWAEPLKSQIARHLAEQLAEVPGLGPVTLASQDGGGEPDVRVSLDLVDIQAIRGSAVTMRASWVARRKSEGQAGVRQVSVREPVRDDSFESLVAAHGRALDQIGERIAKTLLDSAH
jgi:uncharacterized protein